MKLSQAAQFHEEKINELTNNHEDAMNQLEDEKA